LNKALIAISEVYLGSKGSIVEATAAFLKENLNDTKIILA